MSIGEARPSAVVAVAHGLGLPVEKTLRAIYQAPALLVSDIEAPLADKLSAMLGTLGLRTQVTSERPAGEPQALFDIAVHLRDPTRAFEVADAVAGFCACDAGRALAMLIAAPPVVLGGVSRATVAALERCLPLEAVEVTASDSAEARYVLIDAGLPAPTLQRLRGALAERGHGDCARGDLIADDLGFDDAQSLWETFGRTGALRIVNRDFLRFEIWLDGRAADADDAACLAALEALAAVPREICPMVLANPPAVLESGLGYESLAVRMCAYAEAGLCVRAELTTFQAPALDIVAAADRERLASALDALGLPRGDPPFRTPPMPETQARIARAILESAGSEAYFAAGADG